MSRLAWRQVVGFALFQWIIGLSVAAIAGHGRWSPVQGVVWPSIGAVIMGLLAAMFARDAARKLPDPSSRRRRLRWTVGGFLVVLGVSLLGRNGWGSVLIALGAVPFLVLFTWTFPGRDPDDARGSGGVEPDAVSAARRSDSPR